MILKVCDYKGIASVQERTEENAATIATSFLTVWVHDLNY